MHNLTSLICYFRQIHLIIPRIDVGWNFYIGTIQICFHSLLTTLKVLTVLTCFLVILRDFYYYLSWIIITKHSSFFKAGVWWLVKLPRTVLNISDIRYKDWFDYGLVFFPQNVVAYLKKTRASTFRQVTYIFIRFFFEWKRARCQSCFSLFRNSPS